MKRLFLLVVFFAIAFAIFVLGPPFLKQSFGPYPLIRIADVFDLLTPIILIPLYWLLFRLDGKTVPSLTENLLFLIFAACWVLGQEMHLSANSIGHIVEGMEGTDVYKVTGFYDETLSHYFWHFGVISLSGLLTYRQWKNPVSKMSIHWALILAVIFYGFTFFAMVIEGGTVPMGLSLAIIIVLLGWLLARKRLTEQPVLFFFLVAYSLAIILFAIWGIWQGGFPEFSEVGII